MNLLQGDLCTGCFESCLCLFCGLLVYALENVAWGTVNDSLSLTEAEVGECTNLLDDLDLLVASSLKNDVERVLLFSSFSASATSSAPTPMPILISRLFTHLVSKLPSNIFVFIFVGGFFSSAGVVLLTGWTLAGMLWMMQIYPWGGMLEDFASYWLLVVFSEAWLTGMLLTVLVVYRPEQVAMFDAARYIDQA